MSALEDIANLAHRDRANALNGKEIRFCEILSITDGFYPKYGKCMTDYERQIVERGFVRILGRSELQAAW